MKSKFLLFRLIKSTFLVFCFTALSIASNAANITSTGTGGNWFSTTTWIGGVIPATTDNVIINAAVYVNGNVTCANLTVNTGSFLYNTYANSPTVTVTGTVLNNGSILTNPGGYSFYLDLKGNITNNGAWNINTTTLSGTTNQTLQEAAGMKFEGYMVMTDSIGDVVLGSDVLFYGNTFDLTRTKIKTSGFKLLTYGCTLRNGYIESNDILKLDQSSIKDLNFTGAYTLDGNVYSQTGNIFNGTLTVVDTFMNQFAWSPVVKINGAVVNNGTIINNPQGYSFDLEVDGNLTNNGIWRVSSTVITGTANHNLQELVGKVFEGPFSLSDSIGELILTSDVKFLANSFNLNRTTLRTNGFKLQAQDHLIQNGSIISNDTMQLQNTSIESLNFFGDYKLDGNILAQSNNIFNGNCTILDTLFNKYAFSPTIKVKGNIVNKGTISKHPAGYSLDLDITGNITNEGIWIPTVTNFVSITNQNIQQTLGKKFEGYLNSTDSLGDIVLTSDVMLESNSWNLNNTILRTNGHKLLSNAYTLLNGKIISNDTSILNNSSINNMRFYGNYILGGNLYSQTNNVFHDTVTIIDSLFNQFAWSNIIQVKGNIINKGTIGGHWNGYTLTLDIAGNIRNEGIWTPNTTSFVGTANQTIQQTVGKKFEGYLFTTDSIGDIILASDIMLESNTWNLNNTILRTNGHKLVSNAYTLLNGKIISNDTSILNNSYLNNMRFYGNYILGGNLYSQNNNVFNDTVTIIDSLFNQFGWSNTILIKGNIINKGTIGGHWNGYSFTLDITGNIRNEGIWIPSTTNLIGTTNQMLEQSTGKRFEGAITSSDSIGEIILGSIIKLESNTWNMSKTLLRTNGYKLLSNNYNFNNGKITSNDTLYLNNSVLDGMRFFGHCKLDGNVYSKSNNSFNDTLTVLDTLVNLFGSSNTLLVNGDLINKGSIISHWSGYSFSIDLKGNLTNNKIFNISTLTLLGTNARTISGSNANGIQAGIYVDDSIRLVGNNTLPNLYFTGNTKAWCVVDTGSSLTIPTISNTARLINYGKISQTQSFDNTLTNSLTFYDASANTKPGVTMTKLIVDHYGYQQHPTATGTVNAWWRIRNFPQNFKDSFVWLKLNYRTDALNGNVPDSLKVFFSANAGLDWRRVTSGVTIDKTTRTITILKAPSYGHYLLAANSLGISTFHPILETVEPRSGGNTGSVTLYLFGAGLKKTSTVKLKLTGQTDVLADTSYLTDWIGESMLAHFNLKGKSIGVYDVVVETPGEATLTKTAYFTIAQGQRSSPWAALSGRDRFLLNRWQTFDINFGNTANVDALGTTLVYVVNDLAGLSVRFPDTKIALPKGITALGPNYTKIADSVSIYYTSDSLTGYIGQRMRVYPFYIPLINAGSSNGARVQVNLTGAGILKMSAWVVDPLYENINYGAEATTEQMPMEVRACITFVAEKYALQQLTGGLPVLSCIGVVDKLFPPDTYLPDWMTPEEKPYTWGSFIWDFTAAGLSMTQCVTGFVPGIGTAVSYGLSVVGGLMDLKENADINEGCWRKWRKLSQTKKNSNGVTSFDPNEIVGPQGFAVDNYISSKGNKNYRIYFENKATATAAALEVFVKDTLDLSKFDVSTFSFNAIGIADTTIQIQEYAKKFTVLYDMYPKKNIIVQIRGTLDTLNGAIAWSFYSLDRTTLELTEDPDLGFLSPNKNAPEGEGNVAFSCKLKKAIPHNTIVSNKASIVFDLNAPIITNTYTNKIDTLVPVSSVTALNPKQTDSTFTVSWSGSDQGCGIAYYHIFVSKNDSPYVLWKGNTSSTSAIFYGKKAGNYKFFSIASDSIGLTEVQKLVPEAVTRVTVGIESEKNLVTQIQIYPNPARNKITVEMDLTEPSNFEMVLVDMTGRVVVKDVKQAKYAGKNTWQYDTSNIPQGVYMMSIKNATVLITKNVMILK